MHAFKWFAQPWALTGLLVLPALALLGVWSRRQRTLALRNLGSPQLVHRLLKVAPRLVRLRAAILGFGLLLLVLGMAGPRWGAAEQVSILGGKDIVVVLDVSRSMSAEQPSRLERARRSLRDLANMLEARGGHRVALVVFAAHAHTAIPLTRDFDHFRFVLDGLDPRELPSALRPQLSDKDTSGTRIGAALRSAVALHDPARVGKQDLLLVSDGDDPILDEEWLAGLQDALQRRIPVHVVAVGDPERSHRIPEGGDVVRFAGEAVETRLNEKLLQNIARRSGGMIFPARLQALPLGKLLRAHLEAGPSEDASTLDDDTRLLEAAPRYIWFLLTAFALLAGSMWMRAGPRRSNGTVALLAVPLLLSALPMPSVENCIRLGNEAFARQDFDAALEHYRQAEARTLDPGLVAYNKAVTLYRLGRHEEAAAHWQRCLEDQAIPIDRQAKAAFDLGNVLVQQAAAKNRRLLEQATAAYRECLRANPDETLRADALHNLELARWQWLQVRTKDIDDPLEQNPAEPKEGKNVESNTKEPGNTNNKKGPPTADAGKPNQKGADGGDGSTPSKHAARGPMAVLPDRIELTQLSPDDTAAALDQLADRVRRERRLQAQRVTQVPAHVKDW